jgi:hypothetical protein
MAGLDCRTSILDLEEWWRTNWTLMIASVETFWIHKYLVHFKNEEYPAIQLFFLCDSDDVMMWTCELQPGNLPIAPCSSDVLNPRFQLSGPNIFRQVLLMGWSWVFWMPKLNIVIPYQFGGILNHYFHPQNWICSRSLWNSWIINIKLVQVLLGSMLFVHPSFPHPLLEFYIIRRTRSKVLGL